MIFRFDCCSGNPRERCIFDYGKNEDRRAEDVVAIPQRCAAHRDIPEADLYETVLTESRLKERSRQLAAEALGGGVTNADVWWRFDADRHCILSLPAGVTRAARLAVEAAINGDGTIAAFLDHLERKSQIRGRRVRLDP